ncbi:MAG: serine/threonine protein kinase [Polyangiaceae bacterium]|nr:serine/threonine protein kinase [Polyangiaceae bacterium]
MSQATPPPPQGNSLQSRIGTKIADRYSIVSMLGEGGIGAVYLADDTATGTKVAIKLLKSDSVDDPIVIARFDREAKTMTEFNHEHIVRALAFGRSPEGDLCLVMEYVPGETLRSLLKRAKPFPVHGTVEVSRQVASALSRAHGMGVVHRDLKPENIMVTWLDQTRPFIKMLDFGMARLLTGDGGVQLTRKGAIFGTPEYMPPEQAMGQPVDARADQYAFGVMIYEMIAGERPFKAKSALEMVQFQIRQTPPSLAEKVPGTPPAVAAVVAKMLAKKADERFPDVQSAYQALLDAYYPGSGRQA